MERRDFIKAISGGLMLLYAGSAVNAAPSGRKRSTSQSLNHKIKVGMDA